MYSHATDPRAQSYQTGLSPEDQLLADLRDAVGEDQVLTDPDMTASFAQDWTGRWSGSPVAVVRPSGTTQVAAVVRACAAHGVGLVPQGGNTGLVGAGVPRDGEVVLSTRRLRQIEPVNVQSRTVEVGAGVTLSELQAHVRAANLDIGIDFGARDSATIGGIIATNAGGERVMRHGTTRAQVVGLEAVLANGSMISRMSGLPKDNVGYDLVQLLVGSEGTLAVITRLVLRLVPYVSERAVALIGLNSVADALGALQTLRSLLPGLEAADYFHDTGMRLVVEHKRIARPFLISYPVYLIAETAGPRAFDDLTYALTETKEVHDAVLGGALSERHRLWSMREGHTEAISAAGIPVKLDVAVPTGRLQEFEKALAQLVRKVYADAQLITFGHLAEGNVHVNILNVKPSDRVLITDHILRTVIEFGGSISAEHGVGRAKSQWLGLARGPADVAAMNAIKQALDPGRILSPGRIFP